MTEREHQSEAREAAQHVADSTEAWEHASEEPEVRRHLDQGLAEAGVDVPEDERDKLVEQVLDDDEKPIVDAATPEDR